jgi:hypothetical protein
MDGKGLYQKAIDRLSVSWVSQQRAPSHPVARRMYGGWSVD